MKLSGTARFSRCAIALAASAFAHAGEVAPLETFPEVDRIWMGLEEGTIRPAAYQQMRSIAEGYVSIEAEDGRILKKGETWAVFDPEEIDLERRSLAIEEDKLEQQLKKDAADSHETALRLAVDIHEAEIKKQALIDASTDTTIPPGLRSRAHDAILKVDEQLELLREKADPATLQRNLEIAESEGNLLLTRKRKQFLTLEKRSRMLAGFEGELRLSDTVKKAIADREDDGSLIWVNANEHIATIVNDDTYEIVVPAVSPLLSQIPRDELLVFLQEPKTGQLIAGDYARTDEIDSGGEIVRNYVFTIRQDSVEEARHSSGQRGLVHVYRKFQEPLRLIHKKDIVFEASDILASSGWGGLVRSLWPGSTVVQVGPQTIAVMPKDED